MMHKRLAIGTVVTALFLTTGAGCVPAYRSPCLDLAPPTEDERAAAIGGADIDREIRGVDCELVDGSWQEEESE